MRGVCESCGGGTYKGTALCSKCVAPVSVPRKPRRSIEELLRHKAGDHSLCSPDRARHGACSRCGKTIQVGPDSRPEPVCQPCRREAPVRYGLMISPAPQAYTCANADCGREFRRANVQSVKVPPCCSPSCKTKVMIQLGLMPQSVAKTPGVDRATRRTARSRARRLRHAETWDGVGDEEILDRDGWRCQIPGCKRRPIRRDLKYPHPRSKSIDHVIPLSLGGDDTAVNKRAAHLGCNIARGNRAGSEQIALFGVIREPPLARQAG